MQYMYQDLVIWSRAIYDPWFLFLILKQQMYV